MPKRYGMSEDEYFNRMSWLIDTAETPQDKKSLKKDLANLRKSYLAGTMAQPKKPAPMAKKTMANSKPLPVKGKTPTRSGPQGTLKKKK